MAAESKLEHKLRLHAEKLGLLFLKATTPGRRGFPDRMVLGRGGHMLLMELKAPNGVVGYHQERVHNDLYQRGFPVAVVWGYEQGVEQLDALAARAGRQAE